MELSGEEARMLSDEPTSALTDPRRGVLWLVLAHVVVGLVGAGYFADSDKTLRSATFLGIVFSQTSLFGIWGGLGPNPWWQRVIGVVVGVGYLLPLVSVGISAELDPEMFFLVLLATTFVAMPLLIVRFFKVAVQLDSVLVASVGRIQFSIRHLMILTFVVACLITIGKLVQPFAHGGVRFWLFSWPGDDGSTWLSLTRVGYATRCFHSTSRSFGRHPSLSRLSLPCYRAIINAMLSPKIERRQCL